MRTGQSQTVYRSRQVCQTTIEDLESRTTANASCAFCGGKINTFVTREAIPKKHCKTGGDRQTLILKFQAKKEVKSYFEGELETGFICNVCVIIMNLVVFPNP